MDCLSSQLSFQKKDYIPFPTRSLMDASNRSCTCGSTFMGNIAQARLGSIRLNHNHLVRSA
jgi:hypothetical protein